ncbi:hypothetical protein [Algoriphagus marincola]|uniref:hypothetical protein n=1 Tax=Algoriphagus marincola TaxID=264027 RepID=UPI0004053B8C|nr:hypothetical protein [Algoriphagus marincola]
MNQNLQKLASGLTRIKKIFNKKSSFTGKTWVLIDESQRGVFEIEFFRDGRMLYILGSNVTWGKWDISPSSDRLILDWGEKSLIYNVKFADDSIMTVQSPGSEVVEVFVNRKKIPDLIADFYISKLWKKHKLHRNDIKREFGSKSSSSLDYRDYNSLYDPDRKRKQKPSNKTRTSTSFDHLAGFRTRRGEEKTSQELKPQSAPIKPLSRIKTGVSPVINLYRDFFNIMFSEITDSPSKKHKQNQTDTIVLGIVGLVSLGLIIWSFFW